MSSDLIVRSRRVVTPSLVGPAAIHIHDGVITTITGYDEVPAGVEIFDAGDSAVMPGLVDTHVHINEPGRTEWEGFDSATRAAAAGGVTTLFEMPLNSIPSTTTVAALEQKLAAASGQVFVDVGFWGGVVPGNPAELRPLFDAGVFGFKCFLVPSGVEEFPQVAEPDLRQALGELARLPAVLHVHAEAPGPIERAAEATAAAPPNRYATWLNSRPRSAETEAIAWMIGLSAEFSARIHIVHLACADALMLLRWARNDGLPVTVETCPHYLYFAAEDIPPGATQFKCAPPIREEENRERLWAGLGEGLIDMVVSDHSPCPPELKRRDSGDFLRAWGGISSLQLGLPVMWTEMRRRGYSLGNLVQWMCRGPAAVAGLVRRKGNITEGCYADLVVWNPEASFRVEPGMLLHRHKHTPYLNQELFGVVETTFLRGRVIYRRGEFPAGPAGHLLKRGQV